MVTAVAVGALLIACVLVSALPAAAAAEQASEPSAPAAGRLDAGRYHSCAVLAAGSVRCWGLNGDGQLGYANPDTIGDDETPGSVAPVDVGAGRTAKAIAAGDFHTCALLDDASVRCWGFGGDGRLGYANINNVRDPSSVGPVDLGARRTAKAITTGAAHTCALLDDGNVRCWGFGGSGKQVSDGRLGYGNTNNVGDDEPPGSVGPVKLGRSAVAISAGDAHTCAVLDDGNVRCWGYGGGGYPDGDGRLGYGNTNNVGDTPFTTPDTAGPVNLGPGHTAKAISAGGAHTCAVLDDGTVRCWGFGGDGELGYGNPNNVGNKPTTTPDTAGPVNLGPGRTAKAISAGQNHTCAVLDNGSVRCWGLGVRGRLGYANTNNIGDNETPDSVGPVALGTDRKATAISAAGRHTSAVLDDGHVRNWGYGGNGRLGYCNQADIGDDEPPSSAGPVNLAPGDGGVGCPTPPSPISNTAPASGAAQGTGTNKTPTVGADVVRARGLRSCLAGVATHAEHEKGAARRDSVRQRARARRHLSRHAGSGRRRCLRLYGRTPGRITGLRARTLSNAQIELVFNAPGTDGAHPPAAHSYLIRQSRRPIRNARDFTRADTLCQGSCRFNVTKVGAMVSLTVTGLRPRTPYYYALAARDNVSGRCGPRSKTVKVKTADKGPPEQGGGGGHGHGDPGPPRIPNRRAGSCRALR